MTERRRLDVPHPVFAHLSERLTADLAFVLALLAVGWHQTLFRLGSHPLHITDEALYGSIASEMADGGSWVLNWVTWTGGSRVVTVSFNQKPPLMFQLQAASILTFGKSAFAVRFPAAIATIATALLIYAVVRRTTQPLGGFVGGVAYLVTTLVIGAPNTGREGGTDALLVFLGTAFLVMLVWAFATESTPRLYLAALLLGLAFLAKGLAAGLFAVIAVPIVVRYRDRLRWNETAGAGATGAVVALWWPALMWSRQHAWFVRKFVLEQTVARAAGSGQAQRGMFGFMNYPYIRLYPRWFAPWAIVGPLCGLGLAALAWRRADRRMLRRIAFLWWWALVVFAVYIVAGNHVHYVLPAAVPFAMVVGEAVGTIADGLVGAVSVHTGAVIGAVVVLVVFATLTPLNPRTDRTDAQYRLAQAANEEIPSEATIYLVDSGGAISYNTFLFHTDQDLDHLSATNLTDRGEARYAIVRSNTLDGTEVAYTTVGSANVDTGPPVLLIDLEPEEPSSSGRELDVIRDGEHREGDA